MHSTFPYYSFQPQSARYIESFEKLPFNICWSFVMLSGSNCVFITYLASFEIEIVLIVFDICWMISYHLKIKIFFVLTTKLCMFIGSSKLNSSWCFNHFVSLKFGLFHLQLKLWQESWRCIKNLFASGPPFKFSFESGSNATSSETIAVAAHSSSMHWRCLGPTHLKPKFTNFLGFRQFGIPHQNAGEYDLRYSTYFSVE